MKVLIAEDDPRTLAGIMELLESDGYCAIGAETGDEALRLFDSEQPDFVCLDIMLPERSGYELCREIRRRDASVPVIFVSAKSEEVDKVVGLELGADDYISKPFGARELLSRVYTVARRCQPARAHEPAGEFALGELRVSPNELRARADDRVIDLSPRDVKILHLFATRAGQVVTRDELFTACWGGRRYHVQSRTVDQTISQLRKKIERDPRAPRIIETVHGAGYRYDGAAG